MICCYRRLRLSCHRPYNADTTFEVTYNNNIFVCAITPRAATNGFGLLAKKEEKALLFVLSAVSRAPLQLRVALALNSGTLVFPTFCSQFKRWSAADGIKSFSIAQLFRPPFFFPLSFFLSLSYLFIYFILFFLRIIPF